MTRVLVVGVDPGLVHTGVVSMLFNDESRIVLVDYTVVMGLDPDTVDTFINNIQRTQDLPARDTFVFIEHYRPRSNFGTDSEMTVSVREFGRVLKGSKIVDNTGVKKIVKKNLMQLLQVYTFMARTHHDDLRSAARIAILGMLKDENLNALLTHFVRDYLNGEQWNVQS